MTDEYIITIGQNSKHCSFRRFFSFDYPPVTASTIHNASLRAVRKQLTRPSQDACPEARTLTSTVV